MIALKKALRKAVKIILFIIGILFTIAFFGVVYMNYYFMKIGISSPLLDFRISVTLNIICFLLPGILFLVASHRMKSKDTNHIQKEDTNEFLL